jgi:hypothetical protein
MSTRKRALLLAGPAVAVAAAIVVGRSEGNREIRSERAGIARIFAEAAARPIPDGWRIASPFRCLLYRQGSEPFAFELCFDPRGRLVEAIDRRSGLPVTSTLRWEPGAATIAVDSAKLDEVLKEMGAFRPGVRTGGAAVRPSVWFREPPPPPRLPAGSGLPGAPS